MIRKKRGLITREKPDFRDYFKGQLEEEGFSCDSIETPFKKGFPDLIAVRNYTWFLELKWLRNVGNSQDPKLAQKLLDETTLLQRKWMFKKSEHTWKVLGNQIYGFVGGYYEGDEVKTAFIQVQNGEDMCAFIPDFKDWATMDATRMVD